MKKFLAIFLILLLPGMSILIPGIEAKNDVRHVAIEFNETCEILISLNDTDTCSTPEFIKSLYPETILKPSFQKLFDEAKKTERTYYQTSKAILNHQKSCISKDYCNVFADSKNRKVFFWYSPANELREYLDVIITIQPNILHKNINITNNPINQTQTTRELILDVNQIIIQKCKWVTYDPEIIWKELGFIIYYTINDCKDPKHLGQLADKWIRTLQKHDFDIGDSPNFQYYKELEAMKERCKQKC